MTIYGEHLRNTRDSSRKHMKASHRKLSHLPLLPICFTMFGQSQSRPKPRHYCCTYYCRCLAHERLSSPSETMSPAVVVSVLRNLCSLAHQHALCFVR